MAVARAPELSTAGAVMVAVSGVLTLVVADVKRFSREVSVTLRDWVPAVLKVIHSPVAVPAESSCTGGVNACGSLLVTITGPTCSEAGFPKVSKAETSKEVATPRWTDEARRVTDSRAGTSAMHVVLALPEIERSSTSTTLRTRGPARVVIRLNSCAPPSASVKAYPEGSVVVDALEAKDTAPTYRGAAAPVASTAATVKVTQVPATMVGGRPVTRRDTTAAACAAKGTSAPASRTLDSTAP